MLLASGRMVTRFYGFSVRRVKTSATWRTCFSDDQRAECGSVVTGPSGPFNEDRFMIRAKPESVAGSRRRRLSAVLVTFVALFAAYVSAEEKAAVQEHLRPE